jgi:DegV family protein with EDD domain
MDRVKRIAVVTDSTSDLPPDVVASREIHVIPLNVHFGVEIFFDRVNLSSEEFLRRLTSTSELPTTSQPSVGAFEELFREIARTHDQILCVLLSSRLSGTIQSAQLAAQAVAEDIEVEVVDSMNSSLGLGFQAVRACELRDAGTDLKEIARILHAETTKYHLVFFADTLEFLHRGGRIGKAATMVGSLLQLKPLIRVEEGVVIPFERTRTRKKALAGLQTFVEGFAAIDTVAALHVDTPDDAQALIEAIAPRANQMIVPVGKIGPVLATHIGPGAVGVVVREST